MSIVITDPALIAQLAQAADRIEIRDGNGNYLGMFAPSVCKPPPGFVWPFSDEEIAERRKQPGGRKLEDILRDLEKRG